MPIEQSRLYQTIQAARTYQHRYKRLRDLILRIASQVDTGTMPLETAYHAIISETASTPALDPAAEVVIEVETVRYNTTHRRSVQQRLQIQAKRASQGKTINVPPDKIDLYSTDPNFYGRTPPKLDPMPPTTEAYFAKLDREFDSNPEAQKALELLHQYRKSREGSVPDSEITSPAEPDLDDKDLDL